MICGRYWAIFLNKAGSLTKIEGVYFKKNSKVFLIWIVGLIKEEKIGLSNSYSPHNNWLESCGKNSELMNKWPVTTIHHPIDTNFWEPYQNQAKKNLGLNLEKNNPLWCRWWDKIFK